VHQWRALHADLGGNQYSYRRGVVADPVAFVAVDEVQQETTK
jgi:hypothetical protein